MKLKHAHLIWALLAALVISACGGGGGTSTSLSGSTTGNTTSFPVGTQIGGARQGAALNLTNTVSTLAGSHLLAWNYGSVDGTGTAATFYNPSGITSDGTNLFVADMDSNMIRKVVISTGVVTTIAGTAPAFALTCGVLQNGTGTSASFCAPSGITTDGTNVFVTEPPEGTIRKIVIASGAVTTLAGTPGAASYSPAVIDGTGAAATLLQPLDVTTDGTNLYVSDGYGIRKINIATASVTTLVSISNGLLGVGPITTDGTNLYTVGPFGRSIVKIQISSGAVTQLAGSGIKGIVDGTGAAASFGGVGGITTDGTNLYVMETQWGLLRKIVISTGVVTTLAGSFGVGGNNGTGTAATFSYPMGITSDGSNLYIADKADNEIRKVH